MKYIALFLVCLSLTACDHFYFVYVYNKSSSDAYIKTKPSIESLHPASDSFRDLFRDSILKHKISQKDGFSTYKVASNERFLIDAGFDRPSIKHLPVDWIELNNAKDTIILDGKEKIFKQLIKVDTTHPKRKNGSYYIEIKN